MTRPLFNKGYKKSLRNGVTLLETIFVLIIAVTAITAGSYFVGEHTKQQMARNTADHLIELTEAYNKYIQDNYSDLIKSVTSYKHISFSELESSGSDSGYLPLGFENRNTYGQSYTLALRKQSGNVLQGIIYSRGGEVISPDQALRIAGLVGHSGGYTLEGNPSEVRSNLNGYTISLTNFGGGDAKGGKLVSAVFFSDQSSVFEDYLYRNKIDGRPDLNQMNTDLSMGDGVSVNWNVNDIKNLNVLEDLNVGVDVNTKGNVHVKENAFTKNLLTGGKAQVGHALSVSQNLTSEGSMRVEGYIQGNNGVRSLKEGNIGGYCSGGDIGVLAGGQSNNYKNTTLFCRKGRWITADYAIGNAQNEDWGGHTHAAFTLASSVIIQGNGVNAGNNVEANSMYCNNRLDGPLMGLQGGMYFLYDRKNDKGYFSIDCRGLALAIGAHKTIEKVPYADVAGHAKVANSVTEYTRYHTRYVTRRQRPPKDDD